MYFDFQHVVVVVVSPGTSMGGNLGIKVEEHVATTVDDT